MLGHEAALLLIHAVFAPTHFTFTVEFFYRKSTKAAGNCPLLTISFSPAIQETDICMCVIKSKHMSDTVI